MNFCNQKEFFKIREIASKKLKDKSVLENNKFLKALAEREVDIINGKKLSILYLR